MATQTQRSSVHGSIAVVWTAGRPLGRVRRCDANQIDGCPALSDLLQIKPVEERRGKQKLGLASKAGSCALCLTYRSGGGDTGLTHKVVAVTSQCAYYNVPSHNITITARSLAVTLDQFREQLIAYEGCMDAVADPSANLDTSDSSQSESPTVSVTSGRRRNRGERPDIGCACLELTFYATLGPLFLCVFYSCLADFLWTNTGIAIGNVLWAAYGLRPFAFPTTVLDMHAGNQDRLRIVALPSLIVALVQTTGLAYLLRFYILYSTASLDC